MWLLFSFFLFKCINFSVSLSLSLAPSRARSVARRRCERIENRRNKRIIIIINHQRQTVCIVCVCIKCVRMRGRIVHILAQQLTKFLYAHRHMWASKWRPKMKFNPISLRWKRNGRIRKHSRFQNKLLSAKPQPTVTHLHHHIRKMKKNSIHT